MRECSRKHCGRKEPAGLSGEEGLIALNCLVPFAGSKALRKQLLSLLLLSSQITATSLPPTHSGRGTLSHLLKCAATNHAETALARREPSAKNTNCGEEGRVLTSGPCTGACSAPNAIAQRQKKSHARDALLQKGTSRFCCQNLFSGEWRSPWQKRWHLASHLGNFLFRKVNADLSTGHGFRLGGPARLLPTHMQHPLQTSPLLEQDRGAYTAPHCCTRGAPLKRSQGRLS